MSTGKPGVLKFVGLVVVAVALVIIAAGLYVRETFRSGALQEKIFTAVAPKVVTSPQESNLLHQLLGFEQPKTYLVLFLNNTEIRPGGGFIGAYAVLRVDKGVPTVLKVDGSESLDNAALEDFASPPLAPLAEFLKVKRWLFRDSNWSPDFASSSINGLRLYTAEQGLLADKIDGVIGFTPTIIEKLLTFTGPVTADGVVFQSKNFTEQLEYEVEYNYAKRGLEFKDRKKILTALTRSTLEKAIPDIVLHWGKYLDWSEQMLKEKQLVFYARDPKTQDAFRLKGWSGELLPTPGDRLIWSDANLGALKTDWAITRSLSYAISPATNTGAYQGSVTMKYVHGAPADWRTSRYLTYARLFVPPGTRLIGATITRPGASKPETIKIVDQGTEGAWQWFGATLTVPLQSSAELRFNFLLSPEVATQISVGDYHLRWHKQLGTPTQRLTLNLDFDTPLKSAIPGEAAAARGDKKYQVTAELNTNKDFAVQLAPRSKIPSP